MPGNGGSHGLPSWTLRPYIPHASSMAGSSSSSIFATLLIGAITPSTRDTGCSCMVLMILGTLAKLRTLTWFVRVTHLTATRLAINLCLSENGLIFVTRTPTFMGRSSSLRYEDARPVIGLPRLIGMHSPSTLQCFATLFLCSTLRHIRYIAIAVHMFQFTLQLPAMHSLTNSLSRPTLKTSRLALDKRYRSR